MNSKNQLSKGDISILIGNLLDHFDTTIYSFLVPILAPILFPAYDPVSQLILAYSVLILSLVTRPLGSFIFGIIAIKRGPIMGMYYSLIGVAITTVLFGLLPTYETAGWYATFALIILKSIKGIFAAGESSIAKLYITENKAYNNAFRASYLYQSSTLLGIIFASGISAIVIYFKEYPDLWRFCFFFGGTLAFVANFMRRNCTDLNFKQHKLHSFNLASTINILGSNKLSLIKVIMVTGLSHVTYSIPLVVMNSLVPLMTDITLATMMSFNTVLLIGDLLLVSFVGHFIIRFNYIIVMITACLAIGVVTPGLFFFLKGASLFYVTCVRIWVVFWGVVFMCPQNLYYRNLFNGAGNYVLVGISTSIGVGIIGRFTPLLLLWIWRKYESTAMIGSCIAIISITTAMLLFPDKQLAVEAKKEKPD